MRQSIVHVALVVRDYDEESFLFLNTDDFWRDYNDMVAKGIKFIREPKNEPYGIVAVFEDLYGNRWDLLQLNNDLPR